MKYNIEKKVDLSRAEELEVLFRDKKRQFPKLWKKYMELAEFEEPVIILIRRSGNAALFHRGTEGEFRFVHSDREERVINLNPRFLINVDNGRYPFKCYILHEDEPFPLPQNPLLYGELLKMLIDKTLFNIRKHKASEIRARGDMYYKIAIGIAIVIALYIVYVLTAPTGAPTVGSTVKSVGQGIKNVSILN